MSSSTAPLNTVLLNPTTWDLLLDSSGNVAMAQPPYVTAQDVASAVKVFLGELYYDTSQGIPYEGELLGTLPPASLLVQWIQNIALTVPGVAAAVCVITAFNNRGITGQIQITNNNGSTTSVSL